jgi:hypothetical protein
LQAKNAAALQDVEADVERLRVKAAAKARPPRVYVVCAAPRIFACRGVSCVRGRRCWLRQVREFLLQRFYGLRKPKTNIQARDIATSARRIVGVRGLLAALGADPRGCCVLAEGPTDSAAKRAAQIQIFCQVPAAALP